MIMLTPQTLTLEDALVYAQRRYSEAANAVVENKYQHEQARAEVLTEGVQGRNAEESEPRIRQVLQDKHIRLESYESTLNAAKSELEAARLEWDCLRYGVRLLEALRDTSTEGKAA